MSDIAFSVIVNNNGIDDIVFKTIMLKGDKGNSVDHVEKTSTSGLVDTYTIYLTDGTIGGTFTVTNGSPVNIDDTVTAIDKTWSSSKLSGMIKSIDDNVVNADKLWSSQKINSMLAQTGTIEDVAIASFNDGADDVPVSELIVAIEPVQAGSGEPSPDNERVIHGWTECNLSRCGVNLWDEEWELGNISNANGDDITDNTKYRTVNYIKVTPEQSYYFCMPSGNTFGMRYYGITKNYIGYEGVTYSKVLTIPANVYYVRFVCTTDNVYGNNVSFNYPSSDTSYKAYKGDTATIEFGQTVYSGSLDLTNGVLTVDSIKETVRWSVYKTTETIGTYTRRVIALSNVVDQNRTSELCNVAPYLENYSSDTLHFYCGNTTGTPQGRLYMFLDENTLPDGFDNIEVLYPLATPFEIDLTPTEVRTLLNANNIHADTGNIEKLVYFKTGSEAVARMIEAYMRAQPEE